MGEIDHKGKLTQRERVLEVFRNARRNGNQWVDGTQFVHWAPAILQYHTRMFELEAKGFTFEQRTHPGGNWNDYRLIHDPELERIGEQVSLFSITQQRPAYGP